MQQKTNERKSFDDVTDGIEVKDLSVAGWFGYIQTRTLGDWYDLCQLELKGKHPCLKERLAKCAITTEKVRLQYLSSDVGMK